MNTLSHIRKPLPRKGGNSFYRDKNDYSRYAATLCGAPVTDKDIDYFTAGTKKFLASDWALKQTCGKCLDLCDRPTLDARVRQRQDECNMRVKPFSQWMQEDAPAMAAGNGGVAGIGVPAGSHFGEPGFHLPRKKKADESVPFPTTTGGDIEIPANVPAVAPENKMKEHHEGIIRGLQTELGRIRFQLTRSPKSRRLREQEASVQRKITRRQNLVGKTLEEGYLILFHGTVGELERHTQHIKWKRSKPSSSTRIQVVAHDDGGDVAFPHYVETDDENPIQLGVITEEVKRDTFAGVDVFEVSTDKFMAGRFGKNRYHRYSRYVGEDETGEAIRQHGRGTKRDIILKDGQTGAMVFFRRKGIPTMK